MESEKTHFEARHGETGWETACGRESAGLTRRTYEVDCKACRRTSYFRARVAEGD